MELFDEELLSSFGCTFQSAFRILSVRFFQSTGDKEQAARTIISVVNYLRKQDKPLQSARAVTTKWDNNFWLDINYFDLAQMAFECSSYFAAVMFAEIWCDVQRLESLYFYNL